MPDQKQPNLSQDASLHRFREYVVAGIVLIIGLGTVIMMIIALQSTAKAESPETLPDFIWGYFYRDSGVPAAQIETLDELQIFLPIINRSGSSESIKAQIFSISGYRNIEQTETDFQVGLSNHARGDAYDIYLANTTNAYKICTSAITDLPGQIDVSCDLSAVAGGLLPPGLYDLFSTVSGTLSPKVAIAASQVEIIAISAPARVEIFSISGYSGIEQTETNFLVGLSNHNGVTIYDIYLADSSNTYLICANVPTDVQGDADVSCDLNAVAGLIPPGLYDLYSAADGTTSPPIAIADFQVEIIATTAPGLRFVAGDNHWTVGSATQIELVAHQVADEPFTLALFNKDKNLVKNIASGLRATDGPIDWMVDDVDSCDVTSGTPCYLRTLKSNDGSVYAELEVYINQPDPARIASISGYSGIEQTGANFRVRLLSHFGGTFDIYLADSSYTYRICTNVPTDVQGDADVSCDLSAVAGLIPPGLYDLYSAADGTTSPPIAIADFQVEIIATTAPGLRFVAGDNHWTVGSATQIELVAHQVADEPFTLALFNKDKNLVKNIASGLRATDDPIDWMVDDVDGCDVTSGTPCYLRTLKSNDGSVYAELEVYINQPDPARIASISGYSGIEQTETNFWVGLSNHVGGTYDIYLADSSYTYRICTNVPTDVQGDADVSCDLSAVAGLIPPGLYDLYSTAFNTTSPPIAIADFQVEIIATTNPTFRFVNGNNRWAVGEATRIELIAHQVPDEPFTLALYENNGIMKVKDIAIGLTAATAPIDWMVDDVTGCDIRSSTPCFLRTLKAIIRSMLR